MRYVKGDHHEIFRTQIYLLIIFLRRGVILHSLSGKYPTAGDSNPGTSPQQGVKFGAKAFCGEFNSAQNLSAGSSTRRKISLQGVQLGVKSLCGVEFTQG
jgi:hypothetical protein